MADDWWDSADIFDRMESPELGAVEELGGFAPSDGSSVSIADILREPRSTGPSSLDDTFATYQAAIRTPAQRGWTESISAVLKSVGAGASGVVNRFLTPTSAARQPARTVSLSDRLRSGSSASPSRGQQLQMALAGSSRIWWLLAAGGVALVLVAARR